MRIAEEFCVEVKVQMLHYYKV